MMQSVNDANLISPHWALIFSALAHSARPTRLSAPSAPPAPRGAEANPPRRPPPEAPHLLTSQPFLAYLGFFSMPWPLARLFGRNAMFHCALFICTPVDARRAHGRRRSSTDLRALFPPFQGYLLTTGTVYAAQKPPPSAPLGALWAHLSKAGARRGSLAQTHRVIEAYPPVETKLLTATRPLSPCAGKGGGARTSHFEPASAPSPV